MPIDNMACRKIAVPGMLAGLFYRAPASHGVASKCGLGWPARTERSAL